MKDSHDELLYTHSKLVEISTYYNLHSHLGMNNKLLDILDEVIQDIDSVADIKDTDMQLNELYVLWSNRYQTITQKYPHFIIKIYSVISDVIDKYQDINAIKTPEIQDEIKANITENVNKINEGLDKFVIQHNQPTIADDFITYFIQNYSNAQDSLNYVTNKTGCLLGVLESSKKKINNLELNKQEDMSQVAKESLSDIDLQLQTCYKNFPHNMVLNLLAGKALMNNISELASNVTMYLDDEKSQDLKLQLTDIYNKASCVSSLYSGVEKVFNHLSVAKEEKIPSMKFGQMYMINEVYFVESQDQVRSCLGALTKETSYFDGAFKYELDFLRTNMIGAHNEVSEALK